MICRIWLQQEGALGEVLSVGRSPPLSVCDIMHICTPSYVEGVPFKGHFKKIKAKSLKERLESILSEDEESELSPLGAC